ncbi:hypothetical protein [Rickettsia endosymbiont of Ceutorhynchus obstrictus]|uniref:hypothetical protein n=1 Tax=Rickettsia endosymbiont of Ceutorhynchus obstrictus TaxID=3066249 RepID=UPI00313304CF
MIKSRHDTAFFQRSYSSGSSLGMTPNAFAKIRSQQQRHAFAGMTSGIFYRFTQTISARNNEVFYFLCKNILFASSNSS